MNSMLKGRSIASAIIGLLVLGLVAAMALVMNSAGGPVSFVNTAQEDPAEDTPEEPAEGADDLEGEERGEGRRKACRGGGGPFAHAIHGELIVPERPAEGEERPEPGTVPTEFETIEVDNGTVTEVSDTSLTLERLDGVSVTVAITDDTRQREDAELAVGDKVHVVSDAEGTARAVMTRPDRPAEGPDSEGADTQGADAQGANGQDEGERSGRPGPCRRPGGGGQPPAGTEENSAGDVSAPQ